MGRICFTLSGIKEVRQLLQGATRKRQRETVVSHARVETLIEPELADARRDGAGVAADNLAAAMGEDGATHPLLSTPGELRADRRVPDQFAAAPAHHGPRNRGAVTDIERHPVEGVMALVNGGEIWNIEECNTPLCHSISDGRGEQ